MHVSCILKPIAFISKDIKAPELALIVQLSPVISYLLNRACVRITLVKIIESTKLAAARCLAFSCLFSRALVERGSCI